MNLFGWLEDARARRLAIQVGAVVVVVALIVVGAWAWYRSQESRGEAALASATLLVQQASLRASQSQLHTVAQWAATFSQTR